MKHIKTNYSVMILAGIILASVIILPMGLNAEVTVYLDPSYSTDGKDIQLTVENLMDPTFPKPKNQLPVLFIPERFSGNGSNFREYFQQSLNGLPSFRDTLQVEANFSLGIEPYYMDLSNLSEGSNFEANARKIEEAVNLILLHQGTPEAKTKKVVIIAYGNGAASASTYLKDLWERQNKRLSFQPVSEFIAISPTNDDLNNTNNVTQGGYCEHFFASEAPGNRGNNEPVENGILYINFYAQGNRDDVEGNRIKNPAPNVENKEIPGFPGLMNCPEIPGGNDRIAVHRNMVHMPEVICKALYTAFYHQAPPDQLVFQNSDEKNPLSPPIIPSLEIPKRNLGIVLLFDISNSMSQLLPGIQNAVEPFLQLLGDYCDHNKTNMGIAVFPPLLGKNQNNQMDCNGQVISHMTLVTESTIDNAINIIHCLKAQGNTPLLQGIDTSLQMFGEEEHKAIILVSGGHHNCLALVNVNMNDVAIKSRIANLDEARATVYAIGPGQDIAMNHNLLRELIGDRPKNLIGKFIPVMDPELSFNEAYKSIFAKVLKLEEAGTCNGLIKSGETITPVFKINENDRQASFLLRWQTPQKGRLGLTITAADGSLVPNNGEGIRVHMAESYILITIEEVFLKQAGKVGAEPWKVHIVAPGLKDSEQEIYQCSVIMDSALKMKPGFNKSSYHTGDTIAITTTVTKNGRPVPGLTDVTVAVTPPNKSFTEGQGPHGAGGSLIMKEPLVAENIKLYDDGSHGDKEKDDGIYTNQYQNTVTEGTYQFLFHAAGNTFVREKNEPVYVAVKPDPTYSSLKIQWQDIFTAQQAQYLYNVKFDPRDRYGNVIGPGHSVSIEIDYKDKVEEDNVFDLFLLQENPDGTYSGEIGIVRNDLESARLVIMIDGKPFKAIDKIPDFKKWSLGLHGGAGFPISKLRHGHNAGINFNGNIAYHLTPTFSFVGLFGYNYFRSSSSLSSNSLWWNISFNVRSEIVKNPLRFYMNAGVGLYIDKNGDIKNGVNIGTGTAYSWLPNFSIEIGADFHLVNTLGNDSTFLVTHAGLIYKL